MRTPWVAQKFKDAPGCINDTVRKIEQADEQLSVYDGRPGHGARRSMKGEKLSNSLFLKNNE